MVIYKNFIKMVGNAKFLSTYDKEEWFARPSNKVAVIGIKPTGKRLNDNQRQRWGSFVE